MPQAAHAKNGARNALIGVGVGIAILGIASQVAKSKPQAESEPQRRPRGGSSSSQSSSDDDTAEAQRLLTRLGYEPGPVDGEMGEKTRAAIRAFERDHGLPVTGALSPGVIRNLRSPPQRTYAAQQPPPGWQPMQPAPPPQQMWQPGPPQQQWQPAQPQQQWQSIQPAPAPSQPVVQQTSTPPAPRPSAPAVLAGATVLNKQAIIDTMSNRTFSGKEETSNIDVRVFFGPDRTFDMVSGERTGKPHRTSGSWFIEPEADLLCTRISSGPDGRACWRVQREAVLELRHVTGSTKSFGVVSLTFDAQEPGNKIASIK